MDDALARATLLQQASKAAFKKLKELEIDDPHGVIASIKQRVEQRNFAAWERLGTAADEESPSEMYARIRIADDRGRAGPGAGGPLVGLGGLRGRERRAGDARRRGVDARHRRARSARTSGG